MIKQILFYILLFIALAYLLNQARKPTRWIGRFYLWTMNMSHSSVTDWGLKHVLIEKRFTILDVGCGGGRTIQKIAAIATEGMLYGIELMNIGNCFRRRVTQMSGCLKRATKAGFVGLAESLCSFPASKTQTNEVICNDNHHIF
jgi:hypothetical protein